ncbi:hypothetical protein QTJ16_003575 [Diplocarpon rosae]|uniref:Uncharacterized protein n=1 Tax=Diplocarpon rosae TaxID=946125 RepID=A0AAD9T2Y3_9HELO|nr:hypothetical protein QTJ16_003575 [Diplocarpon rosae]
MVPQYDQYGRVTRPNFIPTYLPSFSPAVASSTLPTLPVPSSGPVIITAAMDAAQTYFHANVYTPDIFRAWIVAGINQARAALAAENSSPSEATLLQRRIFEMLDSSTEKSLEKIETEAGAKKLLCEIDEWETGKARPSKKEIMAAKRLSKGIIAAIRKGERKLANRRHWMENEAQERKKRAERQEDTRLRKESEKFQAQQDAGVEVDEDQLP